MQATKRTLLPCFHLSLLMLLLVALLCPTAGLADEDTSDREEARRWFRLCLDHLRDDPCVARSYCNNAAALAPYESALLWATEYTFEVCGQPLNGTQTEKTGDDTVHEGDGEREVVREEDDHDGGEGGDEGEGGGDDGGNVRVDPEEESRDHKKDDDTREIGNGTPETTYETLDMDGENGEVSRTEPTFSKEDVSAVIQEHLEEIRYCWKKVLVVTPTLEGTIKVRFIIITSGEVAVVEVVESTLNHRDVEGCVVEAIKSWTFPQPPEPITITYPFVFK